MRLIITGGTGYLARQLGHRLSSEHDVRLVSRQKGDPEFIGWDEISSHITDDTAIIHLAGENIGEGRWTAGKKERILSSRVESGRKLTEAIRASRIKPKLLLQASGVAFYGRSDEKSFTEKDPPANGDDFLSNVCIGWENATKEAEAMGVRRIIMRIGVVLGREGALPKLALPFRLFAGGPLGNGTQPVSWIHEEDFIRAVGYFLANDAAEGAYNLSSPAPVSNTEFAQELGRALHRPSFLPVPAFALKLILGEAADYIALRGQSVLPARLLAEGFSFRYPAIRSAFTEIYG